MTILSVQECDQVHIDDVSSDDNGQDLRLDTLHCHPILVAVLGRLLCIHRLGKRWRHLLSLYASCMSVMLSRDQCRECGKTSKLSGHKRRHTH